MYNGNCSRLTVSLVDGNIECIVAQFYCLQTNHTTFPYLYIFILENKQALA